MVASVPVISWLLRLGLGLHQHYHVINIRPVWLLRRLALGHQPLCRDGRGWYPTTITAEMQLNAVARKDALASTLGSDCNSEAITWYL